HRDGGRRLDDGDEALARGAVGTLRVALRTLESQDLDGLLDVAVRLDEGVLGVDHAGAETLTQRLDVFQAEIRHGCFLISRSYAGALLLRGGLLRGLLGRGVRALLGGGLLGRSLLGGGLLGRSLGGRLGRGLLGGRGGGLGRRLEEFGLP